MLMALRRWLPGRDTVAVMDGGFAALELLYGLRERIVVITRMRKDARLFDPPPCSTHLRASTRSPAVHPVRGRVSPCYPNA